MRRQYLFLYSYKGLKKLCIRNEGKFCGMRNINMLVSYLDKDSTKFYIKVYVFEDKEVEFNIIEDKKDSYLSIDGKKIKIPPKRPPLSINGFVFGYYKIKNIHLKAAQFNLKIPKLSSFKGDDSQIFKLNNKLIKHYFDKVYKNKVENNHITSLRHELNIHTLEHVLKSGKLRSSETTEHNQEGIYFSVESKKCVFPLRSSYFFNYECVLYLSKEIVDKYPYYINPINYQGVLTEKSLFKGEKDTSIDYLVDEMCKDKTVLHEVIVLEDEIDVSEYIIGIRVFNKDSYDLLKKTKIPYLDKVYYKRMSKAEKIQKKNS